MLDKHCDINNFEKKEKVLDIVDVEINGDPGPFLQYVKLRGFLKYKTAHPELDDSTYFAGYAECIDDIVELVVYPKYNI